MNITEIARRDFVNEIFRLPFPIPSGCRASEHRANDRYRKAYNRVVKTHVKYLKSECPAKWVDVVLEPIS